MFTCASWKVPSFECHLTTAGRGNSLLLYGYRPGDVGIPLVEEGCSCHQGY